MSDKFIPLSIPNFQGNELEYVTDALKEGWVSTGGRLIEKFEAEITKYVGSAGAVACQNGTSGIHTSLIVAEVTRDDEVIVPTLTFIAAVNPVKYIGAQPVFMDCDDSLGMDAKKLEDFCQNECDFIDGKLINRKSQKHIKALVIVHVFGNLANMVDLMPVARKYNLVVLEDATEALGSYYTSGDYAGKYAGTIGDIGIYSFNGNKIITTGGGGMIVSNDLKMLKHARHLTTQAKSDELYYKHDEIGFNYRMTNLQAALGLAQLELLESFIEVKQRNYLSYKKGIENIEGLHLLAFREGTRPNYWFYSLICEEKESGCRDRIIEGMTQRHTQVRPIWGLISDQVPYENAEAYKVSCARDYVEKVVNLPCSTNLSDDDVELVISRLKEMW